MPALDQQNTVLAPLKGAVVALAVTATPASFNLFTSVTPAIGQDAGKVAKRFWSGRFLRLHADGGAVYFAFADVDTGTLTISATATGSAPGNTHTAKIESGSFVDVYVPESADVQYLHYVTASGTATLRVFPASPRMAMRK